jgi:acetoin utilization deacetylase AcuC-like enzyme
MTEPLILFHPEYLTDYPTAGVECPARADAVWRSLQPHYEAREPVPAEERHILRVHTPYHLENVKQEGLAVLRTALLAAGGALLAASEAIAGRPVFAIIRPPGHHASPDHYWGFCFFNNIAVALADLLEDKRVSSAFILDFDLHFGDGTMNYFQGDDRIHVFNPPPTSSRDQYVDSIKESLESAGPRDIYAVSAGFDLGENDWGGLLTQDDYARIGELVKDAAQTHSNGRRFALLEGGYNIYDLGANAAAFCKGFF